MTDTKNTRREPRAVLYTRVSTDKQETDHQRSACADYALANKLPITATLDDTASGALTWRKRALGDLARLHPGTTDVIVWEWSRLGRDMVDTLAFLSYCAEHGISLHVVKSGMKMAADLNGKIIATVWALAAEIERDLLRSRTREALHERKRKIQEHGHFISHAGKTVRKLGRPKGSGGGSKLEDHRADIERMRAANVSDAAIARVLQVDPRTVRRFKSAAPAAPKPETGDA